MSYYTFQDPYSRILERLYPKSMLTVSGVPGSGKTTLALELLHQMSKTHPTVFVQLEQNEDLTKAQLKRLNVSLPDIRYTADGVWNEKNKVILLDSADALALETNGKYPDTSFAARLKKLKEQNYCVICVQHQNKARQLTGAAAMAQINDVTILVRKVSGNLVNVSMPQKNRFGALTNTHWELTESGYAYAPTLQERLDEAMREKAPRWLQTLYNNMG